MALYPRAEELLFLSQTFTFISIIYEKGNNISAEEYFKLYDMSKEKYIDNHYSFLEKLIKVHIIELYRIYNRWKNKVSTGEDWYRGYLQNFSLEDQFQIEHIVNLTKSFLYKSNNNKYQDHINKLEELKEEYLKNIQSIPNNSKNEEYIYIRQGKEIDIKMYIHTL